MMSAPLLPGGCLCGTVRFTAAPDSLNYHACHCPTCRRWSAGPFLGIQCGGSVKVENEAALGTFRSSEWAIRQFCRECGTPLFYRLVDVPDHCVVSVEAFDDDPAFHFDLQIFVDEKPEHYDFANSTIKLTGAEVFAAFQASNGGGQNG